MGAERDLWRCRTAAPRALVMLPLPAKASLPAGIPLMTLYRIKVRSYSTLHVFPRVKCACTVASFVFQDFLFGLK